MIRVLLVDDHAVVRTGFRLLLQAQREISVVGEADSGESACQLYLELTPDVVVMDLAMPGMAMSMTTTSGSSSAYTVQAASPDSASPITTTSPVDCSRSRKPVRTTA